MRWAWLLLSLLLGITGCAHRGIPSLPAGHGHLTFAVAAFLEKKGAPLTPRWDFTLAVDAEPLPPLELTPARAPVVFEEAVRTLRGSAGPPAEGAVASALRDILAACASGLTRACHFGPEAYTRPEPIAPLNVPYPRALLMRDQFGIIVFRCVIGTDGKVHDCKAIEGAPLPGVEQSLAALQEARFRPATLFGQPTRVLFTFYLRFSPAGPPLSPPDELAWARLRVRQNPKSPTAWLNLAMKLAEHAPADPHYPQAVARAYALSPLDDWAASEAAWQQVQAGQYAPALTTLGPLVHRERPNPYALETAAAAHFGLNQCTEALAEQRKAVDLLPGEWPRGERKRFLRKLQDYASACAPPRPG
ncbi:energy transducer TonB [Corallococcus interemptor]|uniref:energy transducer TonB n=1 Tax=Corallococcus interemptor TaxID=2316720 RepID=UPI003D013E5B